MLSSIHWCPRYVAFLLPICATVPSAFHSFTSEGCGEFARGVRVQLWCMGLELVPAPHDLCWGLWRREGGLRYMLWLAASLNCVAP